MAGLTFPTNPTDGQTVENTFVNPNGETTTKRWVWSGQTMGWIASSPPQETQDVTHEQPSNLITNGNFLVWQRGTAFRILADNRVKNQTKKQMGLLYYNVEHNTNRGAPHMFIQGRYRREFNNYSSMNVYCADRFNFGWQNFDAGITYVDAPLTGCGFYVYRGFVNPEDSQILENSKYFCRISTSPPPSYSPNRDSYPIYNVNDSRYNHIMNDVNQPTGLTFGAILTHLLGDDRPIELQSGTADVSRVTDVEYVSSYFDPYNKCIPITGNSNIPGTVAKLGDRYWASMRYVVPQIDFKQMNFGTPQAKDLTLRFYARSNVTGDYYVNFSSGWPEGNGASKRITYRKYTIQQPNEWTLFEIGISGDTTNEPYSGGQTGPWFYAGKSDSGIGLDIWWIMGSGPIYLENEGSPDNYNWTYITDGFNWGGNSQVNLLGATGNYFDIAEVSLVESDRVGKIYFPRQDIEILSECKKYYRSINPYGSESTQAGIQNYGTVPGFSPGITYSQSTNEYDVHLDSPMRILPDLSRHRGVYLSGATSSNGAPIILTETSFTRIFSATQSVYNGGLFPAQGPGPEGEENSDYNRLSDDWNLVDGGVVNNLNDMIKAITGHNGSPFREGININFPLIPNYPLQRFGWESGNDIKNYFKIAYGHRGWCSAHSALYGDYSFETGYATNPTFVIFWSPRVDAIDSFLGGQHFVDFEYEWNEIG